MARSWLITAKLEIEGVVQVGQEKQTQPAEDSVNANLWQIWALGVHLTEFDVA